MNETFEERIRRLKDDYDRQPCGKKHCITMDKLSAEETVFSKELTLGDCVIDFENSGASVIQGGVIPILVDFAGVYLARMHSDGKGITPLSNLSESYFRPFILESDKKMIAKAVISAIDDSRITVSVSIENEIGQLKGQAILKFARMFRKA